MSDTIATASEASTSSPTPVLTAWDPFQLMDRLDEEALRRELDGVPSTDLVYVVREGGQEVIAFLFRHAGPLDQYRDGWVGGLEIPEHIVEILIRGEIDEVVAATPLHQSFNGRDDVPNGFGPALEMGLDPILNQHRQILGREW